MEVKRQLDVLDRNSGEHRFLADDDYTIAGITKGLYDPICIPTLVRRYPSSTGEAASRLHFFCDLKILEKKCSANLRSPL
jgi:hypothetical protein